MMCADFTKLTQEVESLDAAGIDIFHMDVMDGSFVPNFALGVEDFKAIRALTNKPLDAHLMIQNPGNYIDLFAKDLGADIIYVHPEADPHIVSTLTKIKSHGKKCGIAINPETSIESIKELFNIIDNILVMTVNPGFSGQPYLDFVTNKIKKIVNYQETYHFKIVVDGAISVDKITELGKIGVNGFVLGTSALFNKDESYQVIMKNLKNLN